MHIKSAIALTLWQATSLALISVSLTGLLRDFRPIRAIVKRIIATFPIAIVGTCLMLPVAISRAKMPMFTRFHNAKFALAVFTDVCGVSIGYLAYYAAKLSCASAWIIHNRITAIQACRWNWQFSGAERNACKSQLRAFSRAILWRPVFFTALCFLKCSTALLTGVRRNWQWYSHYLSDTRIIPTFTRAINRSSPISVGTIKGCVTLLAVKSAMGHSYPSFTIRFSIIVSRLVKPREEILHGY